MEPFYDEKFNLVDPRTQGTAIAFVCGSCGNKVLSKEGYSCGSQAGGLGLDLICPHLMSGNCFLFRNLPKSLFFWPCLRISAHQSRPGGLWL